MGEDEGEGGHETQPVRTVYGKRLHFFLQRACVSRPDGRTELRSS